MIRIKTNPRTRLLIRWVFANGIAWPLSFIGAIILSHLIVNIFYPKETNLIVGLCLGFFVGLAQWLVLKEFIKVKKMWFVISSLGVGLPYAWYTLQVEAGIELPLLFNTVGVFKVILFFISGSIVGLTQSRLIAIGKGKTLIWTLLSGMAWSISITTFSFLLSGLFIGLISLIGFDLILKEKRNQGLNHLRPM